MYLPADTRKLPTGGLGPRVLGYRNNAGPLSRTRCCDIPSLGLRGQTHSLHCSSVWFSQNVERNSLSLSLSLALPVFRLHERTYSTVKCKVDLALLLDLKKFATVVEKNQKNFLHARCPPHTPNPNPETPDVSASSIPEAVKPEIRKPKSPKPL